jgi:integrase
MTLDHQVLPRWVDVLVPVITTEDIQEWITDMNRAPSTVRKAYQALSMVLDAALRQRMILSNPANDVNLPRPMEGEPVFLTVDQVWSLARAARIRRRRSPIHGLLARAVGEMAGCKMKRWTRPRLHIAESVAELSSGKIEWVDTKNHQTGRWSCRRSSPTSSTVAAGVRTQTTCPLD